MHNLPLQQQMLHKQTNDNPTILPIHLLRHILHLAELKLFPEHLLHLARHDSRGLLVRVAHRIVVEGDAVDQRDEQKRPVATAVGDGGVGGAVGDGEEDVGCAFGDGEFFLRVASQW